MFGKCFLLVAACVCLLSRAVVASSNFYEVLGLPNDADGAAIKKAYRKMSLKYHPGASHISCSWLKSVKCVREGVRREREEKIASALEPARPRQRPFRCA